MTTTRRTRALAALAAASALTLSACGGGGEDSGEETSTSSATSEDSEGSEGSGEDTPDEGNDEEAGGDVTAEKSGVTFDVPEGWTTVNPSALLEEEGGQIPAELEEMAKAQGTTGEQLLQNLAQSVDVMVIGETSEGFADNVNVVASPQMPAESDVEAQLEQTGATVSGTEEVETSVGTALATDYTLSMGGKSVHGRMLAVPSDNGAAMITASTLSADESAKVATTIIESIETV